MLLTHYRKAAGFTVIELLIVLAILGILLGIAVPGFTSLFAQSQQETTLSTLLRHHHLARSEAIKNNQIIMLCKSHDGRQCHSDSSWQDGWIIFRDSDNNKQVSLQEPIIYVQQALHNNLTIKYRGFGSHHYVRYFPNGRSTTNGTFTLCNQHSEAYKKAFIISRTGRARISQLAPGNKALQCG